MKRLICLLLILAICLAAAGCAADRKESYLEEVGHDAEETGDPGPPYGCGFDSPKDYFGFYDAIQDPDAIIAEVFAEHTSHSSDVTERETAEMICDLVERAPYPTLAGEDLRTFNVRWRNDGTSEVAYSISWGDDHILLIFYPVNAEESTGEELRMKINKSSNHPEKKEIRYFGAEVDGVPLRVVMSADKEEQAIEVLESIEFKHISELREEYQKEQQTKREAGSEKQAAIDAAEHIVYEDALSYLHHYIGYEEIERLTAERSGLSVITIPQGTELEFMPGCTMETTEDATVLALRYEGQYHLIIPWNYQMRVEHPKGLKKTEKGPRNLVVSPNTVYVPEEDVTWAVVQDEIAEYLKVKELKIRKGAECRLDIGFEKGKGYLWSASAVLSEDEVAEARELQQSDLAVTWFDEEAVEGFLPVWSGRVVYQIPETEETALIWGKFVNGGIQSVPKEWLLPLDFDVLEQKLPAGEYVFSTYGGGCASPPNWWLGLYRKDMTDEEMQGDSPYFFMAKG